MVQVPSIYELQQLWLNGTFSLGWEKSYEFRIPRKIEKQILKPDEILKKAKFSILLLQNVEKTNLSDRFKSKGQPEFVT